ncbi:MAG: hypothetical protein C7B43_04820 [Sulfobacillus benefaciens]|uniref:Uncharacterized protein n=1 Tax=Sulfobacillus benefaciens TaxID=453960 RepID=A0A2T2X8F7_9FIRM|nr:MAG: hypothetical protein C7B43_04820 [Sulfobacillus benefaciens]
MPSYHDSQLNSQKPEITKLLEQHQESRRRIESLGLVRLTPGLKWLMWGLRFYVVGMVILVVINVMATLH